MWAVGSGSQLVVDYPELTDVFKLVTSTQETSNTYSVATLRACYTALRSSFKTCLKLNERGILAMQVSALGRLQWRPGLVCARRRSHGLVCAYLNLTSSSSSVYLHLRSKDTCVCGTHSMSDDRCLTIRRSRCEVLLHFRCSAISSPIL